VGDLKVNSPDSPVLSGALHKRFLGIDVLEAARQRIAWCFDTFKRICVSFSGGKDSTVLLHLVAEEARRRSRRIDVLFVDWEAQYELTIQHVRACLKLHADVITPLWVCLPLTTTNACSQVEPEWVCWDPAKRGLWVRDFPEEAVVDGAFFDFYDYAMTFEHFMEGFGTWLGRDGVSAACLVGIRAVESLNRVRTLINERKVTKDGRRWTTEVAPEVFNVYPLYDWATQDIWVYHGRTGLPYNRVYDRFHQAGLKLSQMRICEPYGDEQRRGLWLFHIVEPQTWARVVARVAGANSGALYAREKGNVLGNSSITLPAGHTWESFARFLLDTMPRPTAEHYRNKIAVYLKWYRDHGVSELPQEVEGDLGSKDKGSWRRICKVLLKNDYWCRGLNFSFTKTSAYQKYVELMKRRRKTWGILDEGLP
jgi:predicted phosphoadenosine phosphosulfate sulfurtransferase